MDKDEIIQALRNIYHSELLGAFPYHDTEQIQDDYARDFVNSPDLILNADFNDYCMTIAGSISYVLNGRMSEIPQVQIEFLYSDFFNQFSMYKFLEPEIVKYPEFNRTYRSYEQARRLLLKLFDTK